MIVNGKKIDITPGITIIELIRELHLNEDRLVVELNKEIIPKEKFSEQTLTNEDSMEIVVFVGGG